MAMPSSYGIDNKKLSDLAALRDILPHYFSLKSYLHDGLGHVNEAPGPLKYDNARAIKDNGNPFIEY